MTIIIKQRTYDALLFSHSNQSLSTESNDELSCTTKWILKMYSISTAFFYFLFFLGGGGGGVLKTLFDKMPNPSVRVFCSQVTAQTCLEIMTLQATVGYIDKSMLSNVWKWQIFQTRIE